MNWACLYQSPNKSLRTARTVCGTALLVGAGSVLELVLAAVGARMGSVLGLTLGWLAALSSEGMVLVPYVPCIEHACRRPTGNKPGTAAGDERGVLT